MPRGRVAVVGWSCGASRASERRACSTTPFREQAAFGSCGRSGRSQNRISRSRGCLSCCGRLSLESRSSPRFKRGRWRRPWAVRGRWIALRCMRRRSGSWRCWPRIGPVLCVVDDAQWVDPASSDALLFTARRLADDRVVVLFGAREGEATYFEARGFPNCARRPGRGGGGTTGAGILLVTACARSRHATRCGDGREPVGAGRDPRSLARAAAPGYRAAG